MLNKKGESVLSIIIEKLYNPDKNISNHADDYIRIFNFLLQMNCNLNIPIDKDGNTANDVFYITSRFSYPLLCLVKL